MEAVTVGSRGYRMPASASALTPAQRAAELIRQIEAAHWALEFIAVHRGAAVHVVGPDDDQPGYAALAERLMWRRFRTVCGIQLALSVDGSLVRVFADERLCVRCHDAFEGETAQARIFEFNSDFWQSTGYAATNNAGIRKLRDSAGELAAADVVARERLAQLPGEACR